MNQGYNLLSMRAWLHVGLLALLGGMLPASGLGQSVADAARQEQARKSASPPAQRVYTNDDLSAGEADVTSASDKEKEENLNEAKAGTSQGSKKLTAGELRTKILAQKRKVQVLEARIAEIQRDLDAYNGVPSNVTVYERVIVQPVRPGFCDGVNAMYYPPSKDKEWCDAAAKLPAELDKKQAELERERGILEQMQEEARRLGYRSVIYDPD